MRFAFPVIRVKDHLVSKRAFFVKFNYRTYALNNKTEQIEFSDWIGRGCKRTTVINIK